MTAFLLDTSAVIGLIERRSPAVRGALSRATTDPFVSVLTFGELAHGVAASPTATERRRRAITVTYAQRLRTLALDGALFAECYGYISVGQRAGVNDRWIVAQAVVNGLELLTEDAGIARLIEAVAWTSSWERPALTLCASASNA
jgi:predicted nucleic acid-binding protein